MPTTRVACVLFFLLFAGVWPGSVPAQDDGVRPLRVAVKVAEPFVIETDAGLEGISIELWRRVADRLGLAYEFEMTTLDGLLEGVASGEYAAGVAATTLTAEREKRMDFTHPFFGEGLAIAVPDTGTGLSVVGMLRKLVSPGFVTAVALLAVVLLGVGLLVWIAERRANPEQFGGEPRRRGSGAGSGSAP
jgi:polar amino acid transport system substrate-binding protein